eukprot:CAMPEP_0117444640 /NCGR_PEP_ID=MMETSP0759-20121206/5349_1 /TAXON_ID=63605 /ORGANISM="Percolomonas cosmopolitus, Strain WS" /LENGTH=231 /DNA_ID=CAMNT_0005236721 /DNA_START=358 /DNA_END=1053 /DNA_ORIENTATION=-
MNFLLTGANRGIGLEFSMQLLAAGHKLWATARNPDKANDLQELKKKYGDQLHIVKMDVADENSVKSAFNQIKTQNVLFDVILNNAGILERGENTVNDWDFDTFIQSVKANTFGPIYVSRTFLPLVKTPGGKIIAMSTRMSSIEDNGSGHLYSYRCSKCCLNMAFVNLSIELKDKDLEVFLLHPGNVATEMNPHGDKTVEEATKQLLHVIFHSTKDKHYGKLVSWDGSILPW